MPIGFVGPALQGASFISRFGVPLLQQAGISAGLAGLGAIANTASKAPSSTPGRNRRANVGSNNYSGVIGSIPPSANGESYRRAELRLADAARPGGGGGGGGNAGYSLNTFTGQPGLNSAADRSYQQEKARVTQLTEQDPMFKKYQVAELTKAYNTASPEEKNKIGLQIWAATNPTLAKKVSPGQVGYQTSASMFGSQAFGTDVPGVTETIYSQAGQQEGVPGGVQFPGSEQATRMNAFSMGADAQQLGVTPPGTTPFPMIGENVFKRGFEVPSSEDLSQTQLALLKRAFESRIK
jgi:hypothetical protein